MAIHRDTMEALAHRAQLIERVEKNRLAKAVEGAGETFEPVTAIEHSSSSLAGDTGWSKSPSWWTAVWLDRGRLR